MTSVVTLPPIERHITESSKITLKVTEDGKIEGLQSFNISSIPFQITSIENRTNFIINGHTISETLYEIEKGTIAKCRLYSPIEASQTNHFLTLKESKKSRFEIYPELQNQRIVIHGHLLNSSNYKEYFDAPRNMIVGANVIRNVNGISNRRNLTNDELGFYFERCMTSFV